MPANPQNPSYHLGGPVWSCKPWIGRIFPSDTSERELLKRYSAHFNTVEANSLFYGLPSRASLERWMAETPEGFHISPKFPKSITHERRLNGAEAETSEFIRVLEALAHGKRLGPSFLQLPPSFNINSFDTLDAYLKSFPSDFPIAVETRHISWYDKGDNERRLTELLEASGADRVIFDSRPLFSSQDPDKEEQDAQARKPQTPLRKEAIGQRPFLRFVGRNDLDQNEPWIREWANVVNRWILDRKTPYIFIHAADETFAPELAQRFHRQLRTLNPLLPKFVDFPGPGTAKTDTRPEEQLDLF